MVTIKIEKENRGTVLKLVFTLFSHHCALEGDAFHILEDKIGKALQLEFLDEVCIFEFYGERGQPKMSMGFRDADGIWLFCRTFISKSALLYEEA